MAVNSILRVLYSQNGFPYLRVVMMDLSRDFIHRIMQGVELLDDWDAMGQNNSVSGTANFKDVIMMNVIRR